MKHWLLLITTTLCACRPAAKTAAPTINGNVSLVNPLVGADIRLTFLGPTANEVVGTTTSDAQGNFSLPLPNIEGTLLIEALGDTLTGSTIDVRGNTVALSYTDRFSTLITNVTLGQSISGIQIGCWSSLVTTRTLWDVATNHKTIAQAIVDSSTLFANHFGGTQFWGSIPIDPATSADHNLSTSAINGFASAAISLMADYLSQQFQITPGEILTVDSTSQLLQQDVSDGVFDGRDANGPIAIVGSNMLPLEASRADLGAALGTFVTGPSNLSGITLSDLGPIINAISNDNSILYGHSPVAAVVATGTGNGPTITLTSPAPGVTVQSQVAISGSAVSNGHGVAGVTIDLDGNQISNGTRSSVNEIDWALIESVSTQTHVITITAQDTIGGISTLVLPFSADSTPPTVTLSACAAYDDRTRTGRPVFDAQALPLPGFNWFGASLPDPNCTSDTLEGAANTTAYMFHTYGVLAETIATSSSIAVNVVDPGPVFTPSPQLTLQATLFEQGLAVGSATIVSDGTTSTRVIPISADTFSRQLLNASSSDLLELRMTVSDAEGNANTQSLFFHLDLLPAPLELVDITGTAASAELIQSYQFSDGSIAKAFDPSQPLPTGLFVLGRYQVINHSDLPIAFSLNVDPNDTVATTYQEYWSYIAGDLLNIGTDSNTGSNSVDPNDITPPHWQSCYTQQATEHINEASLTLPGPLLLTVAGTTSCSTTTAGLATAGTAATPFGVALQNTAGGPLVPLPDGDHQVAANATVIATVGFPKPALPARSPVACEVELSHPSYTSPFAGLQTSSFWTTSSYFARAIAMPDGIYLGANTLAILLTTPTSTTWNTSGWADCSGIAGSVAGYRTSTENALLQVEGIPVVDPTGYENNINVYREWGEFALSRAYQPGALSLVGNTTASAVSHSVNDPITYPVPLVTSSFAIDYPLSAPPPAAPTSVQPALYSAGSFP